MKLLSEERGFKGSRGFEEAGKGEVIRGDIVQPAHVREVREGRGEMTVLDRAGD